MRKTLLAFFACVIAAGEGRADGTYPIYGTSFYGTGEEQTIKNGKGMYSVEVLYTRRYGNPAAEVAKMRSIAGKGFRIILRLDYDYGQTVPADWDWVGRYDYAVRCGQIARDMAGVVGLFVIGNEHAYSGTSFFDGSGGTEDPRFSDLTGLHSFAEYARRIYAKWGPSVKPIYITETNTYWFKNGFSDRSYRDNWIKEAYQAVDQWNQSNDMKIEALCWFTYSHLGITDPGSDVFGNALMRTDSERLNRARADFAWLTANTTLVPGFAGSTLHFEAENFTNGDMWGHGHGLEGTDFHDTTNGSIGGEYRFPDDRPEGDVDIGRLPDWSGFFVGWLDPGEWLRYQTLAGGRSYRLRVRYARGAAGIGSVRLTVDGSVPAGDLGLPSTGHWGSYADAYGAPFYLPPGHHDLRLVSVSGAFNVDFFELVPQ